MNDEELDSLLDEYKGAASIRDNLQTRIDEIGVEVRAELKTRKVKVLDRTRWRAQLVAQERKTIDPKKLLSAGVSVDQIAAATEVTQVEQLRIGPRPMAT